MGQVKADPIRPVHHLKAETVILDKLWKEVVFTRNNKGKIGGN